ELWVQSMGELNYAAVAVQAPLNALDYRIPEPLKAHAQVGMAVRVPFGKRMVPGYIVALQENSSFPAARIKNIQSLDASLPALSAGVLELLQFAAVYYAIPLGELLAVAIPAGQRKGS